MIELMGGSIRVESTQGAGTKFTVDISFDTASEADVYRKAQSCTSDLVLCGCMFSGKFFKDMWKIFLTHANACIFTSKNKPGFPDIMI